jgi:probable rRNA maturation factor
VVALVSDRHIRRLNRQYRRKDRPTDVLAFESGSAFEPRAALFRPFDELPVVASAVEGRRAQGRPAHGRRTNREPRFLGDIVIATGAARRQARDCGHSYATELRVLALHGLLHLLGYDHDDEQDRGRMARAEARLRRKGGLREGLIGRAGGVGPREP